MSRKERDGKEVMHMAIYRIIRIYDVPADNRIEATNRMMEAIILHVERDYHVMDYVKAPEDPKGKGRPINLTPPKGWLKLLMEELLTQITGTGWKTPKIYKGDGTDVLGADEKKR
jgi:hypothetical protein